MKLKSFGREEQGKGKHKQMKHSALTEGASLAHTTRRMIEGKVVAGGGGEGTEPTYLPYSE